MTPAPQPVSVPERVPLAQLGAAGRSLVLARIVPNSEEGPGRVAVAAFQSAV